VHRPVLIRKPSIPQTLGFARAFLAGCWCVGWLGETVGAMYTVARARSLNLAAPIPRSPPESSPTPNRWHDRLLNDSQRYRVGRFVDSPLIQKEDRDHACQVFGLLRSLNPPTFPLEELEILKASPTSAVTDSPISVRSAERQSNLAARSVVLSRVNADGRFMWPRRGRQPNSHHQHQHGGFLGRFSLRLTAALRRCGKAQFADRFARSNSQFIFAIPSNL
jgi:hypothetical protein